MTLFGGHLALAGKPLPDWQHASTLSRFFAGAPQHLQNYHDPVSQSTTPAFLRENFDEVGEAARATAEEGSPPLPSPPCPVLFAAGDAHETTELRDVQGKPGCAFEVWQNMLGVGPEGWDPVQDYTGPWSSARR